MTLNRGNEDPEAFIASVFRVCSALLLGLGLAVVLWELGSLAELLPGIGPQFEEAATIQSLAIYVSVPVVIAALVCVFATRSLERGWDLFTSSAALLVNTLGLRTSTRHAVAFTIVGLVAGVVAYAISWWLTFEVSLPPATEADVRQTAVQGASSWAAGLYFAVLAAPAEEVIYRGALLAVAGAVHRTSWSPLIRRWCVFGLLVLSSCIFAVSHLEYSVTNMVAAGSMGLIFGGVALRCRSVWPAVVAHALHNFLVAF